MADLKLNNVGAVSESSNVITLGSSSSTKVAIATGKHLETSTTGKLKSKGSFMQQSFHQSLVIGG